MSTDGGSKWQERQLPGKRDWAPNNAGAIPRWVEPLAWDASGALYVLWTDLKGVWLGRSDDLGVHWKTWMLAETDAMLYFPYLTARRSGELAATWFSGASGNLHWQACRIQMTDHGEPHVTRSSLFVTESFSDPHDGSAPVRDTAGEYLAALFLHDNSVVVVSPIQNPAAKRFGFSFWRLSDQQ